MHRKVLVPLDGSVGSEAVLPQVGELARAERAKIRLLHVAPRVEARIVDGRVIAYADQEAARVRHEVWAYLVSAAAALSGLDVELAVGFGDPAEEIIREAESAHVDLIAMATHRRKGLRRLVQGSVAEPVARSSTVPVLLVSYAGAADRAKEMTAVASNAAPSVEQATGSLVWGRAVRRRFWCAWSRRDVEVEVEERRFPGIRSMVAVKRCSVFDPPTAVACQRRCLDPAFRRLWQHPPLSEYTRTSVPVTQPPSPPTRASGPGAPSKPRRHRSSTPTERTAPSAESSAPPQSHGTVWRR